MISALSPISVPFPGGTMWFHIDTVQVVPGSLESSGSVEVVLSDLEQSQVVQKVPG